MEDRKQVFLAYRAIFSGTNALIRQPKAIFRVVSLHRQSCQSLLKRLGEQHVVDTLKELLTREVFVSKRKAELAFPDLYKTSAAQDAQHHASEAHAARSEAEVLETISSLVDDRENGNAGDINDELPSALLKSQRYIRSLTLCKS